MITATICTCILAPMLLTTMPTPQKTNTYYYKDDSNTANGSSSTLSNPLSYDAFINAKKTPDNVPARKRQITLHIARHRKFSLKDHGDTDILKVYS